jgi:hypothetical protein
MRIPAVKVAIVPSAGGTGPGRVNVLDDYSARHLEPAPGFDSFISKSKRLHPEVDLVGPVS